ncbi:MAG: TIGR04076 family protein [Chloroflexi bacterium]|nr:TIGR04076 family protein [Chloroflexota bacterium]
MYELKVSVTKVLGRCTACPPMRPGDYFTVRNGDIRIPHGGYLCLWSLQSLLPLLPAKERESAEAADGDWLWRVHHAQCPDPNGRVIWKIEPVGKVGPEPTAPPPAAAAAALPASGEADPLPNLRVVVQEVRGKCTSGMQQGYSLTLRSGRLTLPPGQHFCLYALQAVLPLLPAKQRSHLPGDWLRNESLAICPDPAGNVILRIEEES